MWSRILGILGQFFRSILERVFRAKPDRVEI